MAIIHRLSVCVWCLLCEWLDAKDTHRLRLACRWLASAVRLRSARLCLPLHNHNGLTLSGRGRPLVFSGRPGPPSTRWLQRQPRHSADVEDLCLNVWPTETEPVGSAVWPPNVRRLIVSQCVSFHGGADVTRFHIVPPNVEELMVSGCTNIWLNRFLGDCPALSRLQTVLIHGNADLLDESRTPGTAVSGVWTARQ